MIAAVSANRRLMLAGFMTLLIALTFWLGSRYPSLDEKAMMGGDIQLEALGFDTVVEVRESDPFLYRAFGTTVNWIDTNKRGMAFGLVLAACIMTLLSLFCGARSAACSPTRRWGR